MIVIKIKYPCRNPGQFAGHWEAFIIVCRYNVLLFNSITLTYKIMYL